MTGNNLFIEKLVYLKVYLSLIKVNAKSDQNTTIIFLRPTFTSGS